MMFVPEVTPRWKEAHIMGVKNGYVSTQEIPWVSFVLQSEGAGVPVVQFAPFIPL